MVRKVTSTTLDLESPAGITATMHSSGSEYELSTETKMLQVVFNPDTKVCRFLHRVGAKPELKELTLADLSEGQSITVFQGELSFCREFVKSIMWRTLRSAHEIIDWSTGLGSGAAGYGHHTTRDAGVGLMLQQIAVWLVPTEKTPPYVRGFPYYSFPQRQ